MNDEDEAAFVLDSQAAHALARASRRLVEDFFDDLISVSTGKSFRDTAMADFVPRGSSLKYDGVFARRLLAASIVLSYKLAQPDFTGPSSTAEELVLHAVIARARVELDPSGESDPYRDFIEVFFQDTDVLLLFDPAMDGVEKSGIAERLGFANLEFDEWFEPFGNASDVPLPLLAKDQT